MKSTAVEASPGLAETLMGGPFTVFAPNDNDAFAQIEEGGQFEELKADLPRLSSCSATPSSRAR